MGYQSHNTIIYYILCFNYSLYVNVYLIHTFSIKYDFNYYDLISMRPAPLNSHSLSKYPGSAPRTL